MRKSPKRRLVRLLVRTAILVAIVIVLVCQHNAIHNLQEQNRELYIRLEEVEDKTSEVVEVPEQPEQPEQPEPEEIITELGEFRLTAYCPCEKCCGYWATIRPKDANGNPIVYGATGIRLEAGVSIAVDPSVIPYGTTVIINGHEYIAQDCGGAIKQNRIDVYFDDHQEALEFGVQTATVYIVERSE